MLAIRTKFEYYDSVWVKNEWPRYLGMMKNDEGKSFIACYRNLDAYDIPKQFRGLQALTNGDIGFLKNLMGNAERLPPRKEASAKNNETVPNQDWFLKRAILHLESGEMSHAEEYLESFLDENPTDYRGRWGQVRVYTDDLRTIIYQRALNDKSRDHRAPYGKRVIPTRSPDGFHHSLGVWTASNYTSRRGKWRQAD